MTNVLHLKNPFGDGHDRLFPIEEEKLCNIHREVEKFFGKKLVGGLNYFYEQIDLGQVAITYTLGEFMNVHRDELLYALEEHRWCNWGETKGADWQANFDALTSGARIMSEWTIAEKKIWIITEAEDENGVRQHTTVLLPSDY